MGEHHKDQGSGTRDVRCYIMMSRARSRIIVHNCRRVCSDRFMKGDKHE